MRLGLEPDLQVVGEAGDPASLSRALGELLPDAVVLDIEILGPNADAPAAIQGLRSSQPELAVVVLALHVAPQTRQRWLASGADALLIKQDTGEELPRAIREAVLARGGGRIRN